MALKKEIYKEFESVVGEENICDDPVIMPSYYNTEFAAVIQVLTEEVSRRERDRGERRVASVPAFADCGSPARADRSLPAGPFPART